MSTIHFGDCKQFLHPLTLALELAHIAADGGGKKNTTVAVSVVVSDHIGELLLGYTANGIVCMNFIRYVRCIFEAHRLQPLS